MIEFPILPARHRVVVRVEGEVSGPDCMAAFTGLLKEHREVQRHDYLFDLTRHEGGVTHGDLAAMTCLVSHDPGFGFWTPLMETRFPSDASAG